MRTINDFEKTENFLASKLISAQLDSFHVHSVELQLHFLGDSPDGLQSYWLCMTGDISLTEGEDVYHDRAEVIANLYALIGQRITSVKIEDGNVLSLCCDSKVITTGMDDDSLEVVWSLTPESPDPYADHSWSVTLTDESELVMSMAS